MSEDGSEAAEAPRSGRHRRIPTRRPRWKSVLLGVIAVVAVAVGLGIGFTTWKTNQVASNVSRVENAFPSEGGRPTAPAQATNAVTFLVTAVEPDHAASTG